MEDIQLPTIVAQSVIVNFTTTITDNIATRRSAWGEIIVNCNAEMCHYFKVKIIQCMHTTIHSVTGFHCQWNLATVSYILYHSFVDFTKIWYDWKMCTNYRHSYASHNTLPCVTWRTIMCHMTHYHVSNDILPCHCVTWRTTTCLDSICKQLEIISTYIPPNDILYWVCALTFLHALLQMGWEESHCYNRKKWVGYMYTQDHDIKYNMRYNTTSTSIIGNLSCQ